MNNRTGAGNAALWILAAGFLVLFVGGGGRFVIGLTLKPMAEELGWGRTSIGWAVAVFLAVSATCMFIAGRLADRYSPRTVLVAGLLLSAAGIGFMGEISQPWQAVVLYGCLFAIGNGIASLTPVGVLVARLFPQRTGFANAAAIAGTGAGQLFMIAGLAAVMLESGWRAVYGWVGAAHLLLVPMILLAFGAARAPQAEMQTAAPPAGAPALAPVLRSRHFRRLAIVYAICGAQDFFVATHLVAFAQDAGTGALLAGNLFALMGLTGVAGVLLAGAWSDRRGPVAPTLACFVLRIALCALILLQPGVIPIAAFALLFGLTFWMTAPLTLVFVRNAWGAAQLGALSGLLVMIHHMCGGAGALLGALLFDRQGHYVGAFALMLVLSLAGTLFTLTLRQRGNPMQ